MTEPSQTLDEDHEERWQRRLAVPVLVAALVSVPAIFLTLLDEPWGGTGTVINIASGLILTGETLILFLVSRNKRVWLHRNRWLVLLTIVIIIGVVLAIGPVQLFRLLRVVGALRVLRAGRIIKAGKLLSTRLEGTWAHLPAMAAAILVAVFVAVALADPTSQARNLLEDVLPLTFGPVAVTVAAVLLAVATFAVLFQRNGTDDSAEN